MTKPGGQDIASEADQIIALYRRHADAFARRRDTSLFERPWLDRFRSLLAPEARVLDLGCGFGVPIAGYLVAQGCSILGVDSSPEMITMCEKRFPFEEWHLADMRGLSLGRAFDGIIAWNSFFHLCYDDQRRMFRPFRKHAAARAILMFTSGPAHGEAIGTFEGEPLYHASLDPGEYRALLAEHGFRELEHVVEDPTCGHHTI